jgi:TRAP-type C4-dicarboxylate transport system substrate-binding protein
MKLISRMLAMSMATALTSVAALGVTSPVAAQESYSWNYADIQSSGNLRTRNVEWWISELARRSEGRIKIQAFWAGSLVGGKDIAVGVSSGYPELGANVYVYDTSYVPVLSLFELPLADSAETTIRAFHDMVMNNETVRADLAKRKLVPLTVFGHQGNIMGVTPEAVASPEDLNGLRLRAPGGTTARALERLGAVVVTMPSTDVYSALQLGTVDGAISSLADITEWKWSDHGKHVWSLGIPIGPPLVYVINKDVWDGLPEDTQKLMLDVSAEFLDRQIADYAASLDVMRNELEASGVTFVDDVPGITAAAQQAAEADIDRWLKRAEEAGLPAEQLLNDYREAIERNRR